MTGTSKRGSEEFRALTLTNLLIAIAFFMPIIGVIAELRNARSGLLRYSVGLPTAIASAVILAFSEWHLLRLIWIHSEMSPWRRSETAATVLAVFVFIAWIVAGSMIGDSIAGFLIQHLG